MQSVRFNNVAGLFVCIAGLFLLFYPTCATAQSVLKIGLINPLSNVSVSYKSFSLATIDGARIAVEAINREGGVNGKAVQIVYGDIGGDPSNSRSTLDAMMAAHPDIIALSSTILLQFTVPVLAAMVPYNLTMVGPVAGENDLHEHFDHRYVHMAPSTAAEVTALIKELLFVRNVRRIALMTDVSVNFGNSFKSLIADLLSNLDLKIVAHFQGNHPTSSCNEELLNFVSAKPQAVVLLGPLAAITSKFLTEVLPYVDSSFIISTISAIVPMVVQALPALAPYGGANGRLIVGMMGPSPLDEHLLVSAEFREARALTPNITFTDAVIRTAPYITMFIMMAWLHTRLAIEVLKEMHTYTAEEFNRKLYSTRLYPIGDALFGIYSGECVGSRQSLCRCNEGARQLYLASVGSDGSLIPMSRASLEIPVSECDSRNLPFLSPIYIGSVFPNDVRGSAINSEFNTGRRVFDAISNATREVIDVMSSYSVSERSSGVLAHIKATVSDKMVTVFTGSALPDPDIYLLNLSEEEAFGAIIDPSFSKPMHYQGYRRNIIHISPTLDQQLHAFAGYAASIGVGLRLFCKVGFNCDAILRLLSLSLESFRIHNLGGASVVNAESFGALELLPNGLTLIVGWEESAADLAAIHAKMQADSSTRVGFLLDAVESGFSDIAASFASFEPLLDRIVYATNLPHWNVSSTLEDNGKGTAQPSKLLWLYLREFQQDKRSPLSIRGFYTAQFIHTVSERIPTSYTSGLFLSTLYTVSVVVLDDETVLGPYYDAMCEEGVPVNNCEMNIGARQLYVRPIGSNANRNAFRLQFESGAVKYRPLPQPEEADLTIPLAVGLVSGFVLLLIVAIAVYLLLFTGRQNGNAPKDPSVPITILFTDIQSSTSLWAEIPDVMGPALEDHHMLIRKLIRKHKGYEVKTIGDAFMIAFKKTSDAARLSYELQHVFYEHKWPGDSLIDEMYMAFEEQRIQAAVANGGASTKGNMSELSIHLAEEAYKARWKGLRVRIGVHTAFGDIKKDEINGGYDYYGTVTNTAARTESVAHGGQVVLTRDAYVAVTEKEGVTDFVFISLGNIELRGLTDKLELFQMQTIEGRKFPDLRVEKGQENIDDSLTGSTGQSVSMGTDSSKAAVSETPQAEADTSTRITSETISTLFSVFTVPNRRTQLKQLCSKWRINIPPIQVRRETLVDGKSKSSSGDDDAVQTYLRVLSRRLAPIVEKKLAKHKEAANVHNIDLFKETPISMSGSTNMRRNVSLFNKQIQLSASAWSASHRPTCALDSQPAGQQQQDTVPGALDASASTSLRPNTGAMIDHSNGPL